MRAVLYALGNGFVLAMALRVMSSTPLHPWSMRMGLVAA
jgi:hypothetical protein